MSLLCDLLSECRRSQLRLWSLLHKGPECPLNLHRKTIHHGQAGFRIKGFFLLFSFWSRNSLDVAGVCGSTSSGLSHLPVIVFVGWKFVL